MKTVIGHAERISRSWMTTRGSCKASSPTPSEAQPSLNVAASQKLSQSPVSREQSQVVVDERDFGGGVRLRQVQNTGLLRGGRSAEHDLEGPGGGGPQLVQRLIGPEIKNEPTA
ncbi:hypothetical protein ACFYPZ_29645 [Streptomyces sp. NPDC005506]|uniref:hypothetical protein n=1 Tax=unclassified Streptomyces TaxID=2593676 RepID=UPI0036AD8116